ncbi:MAG: hypothetical protein NG747_00150 [Candidatus Brocadia sp.]|nr:hypothetical protein [Candidatus Brocadia sp.]
MSEYQYYEFRAIDRPLTEAQKSRISALSSRARVTPHMASFVYNYGDFRVLYLAWLKAAENALRAEDIDDDTLEPPVPPGLNQLSDAQNVFVRFLGIDEVMLAVAAQKSKEQKDDHLQPENLVKILSIKEQQDFLTRLSRGEPNLSVLLNRRLHELANTAQSSKEGALSGQRTIAWLIQAAEEWRRCKQEDERRKEELARKRRLEELALKENEVWLQVKALIEEKKPKSYDSAIGLLKDLRELAEYQGRLEEFKKHIAEIQQTYSSRPALRDRMIHARLI